LVVGQALSIDDFVVSSCETTRRVEDLKVHFKEYKQLDGSSKMLVSRVGDGSIITRFDKTPLPGSRGDVVCPHFLELKWATGCPYSCAWCYLQGTFRSRARRLSHESSNTFRRFLKEMGFVPNC